MPDKEFTAQDRSDLNLVLPELVARALDEFSDETSFATMYDGWRDLITKAAMVGDGAFSMMDEDVELQNACKRILGSGRFDYYPGDEFS